MLLSQGKEKKRLRALKEKYKYNLLIKPRRSKDEVPSIHNFYLFFMTTTSRQNLVKWEFE